MYFDYVIVGAGICGITLAERIVTEMKNNVLLIEKKNYIGGKCFDYYDEKGILKGKYGLHVFYTDLQHVWNYVNCFAQWDTMEQHSSLYKYIGIPIGGYTKMFKDRKSTRLNSSHANISYAVFCLKKKKHLLSIQSSYTTFS